MPDELSQKDKIQLCSNMSANLSLLRSKLGISQKQLACVVGISRQTVSLLESGQRELTWKLFLALLLIFLYNSETKPLLFTYEIFTTKLSDSILFK